MQPPSPKQFGAQLVDFATSSMPASVQESALELFWKAKYSMGEPGRLRKADTSASIFVVHAVIAENLVASKFWRPARRLQEMREHESRLTKKPVRLSLRSRTAMRVRFEA